MIPELWLEAPSCKVLPSDFVSFAEFVLPGWNTTPPRPQRIVEASPPGLRKIVRLIARNTNAAILLSPDDALPRLLGVVQVFDNGFTVVDSAGLTGGIGGRAVVSVTSGSELWAISWDPSTVCALSVCVEGYLTDEAD